MPEIKIPSITEIVVITYYLRNMRYAKSLAQLLGLDLKVVYQRDFSVTMDERDEFAEICRGRLINSHTVSEHSLLINGMKECRHNALPVLFPQDEEVVIRDGDDLKIMVPLGNTSAGLHGLVVGISIANIARKRGRKVSFVLYHTTWRNVGVKSDYPRDHMDTDARATFAVAEDMLRQYSLEWKSVAEAVGVTIAVGIAEAAQDLGCHLIVSARGESVVKRSICGNLINTAPTPTLIAGQLPRR